MFKVYMTWNLNSFSPMPPKLARHPHKQATHATHASTYSTPFLKLDINIAACFWIKRSQYNFQSLL